MHMVTGITVETMPHDCLIVSCIGYASSKQITTMKTRKRPICILWDSAAVFRVQRGLSALFGFPADITAFQVAELA